MRLSIAATLFIGASAFAPALRTFKASPLKGMADEVGIPCEEECALESYPNLPPSVHPGVLSGEAMMDLLQHAKDNGKILLVANVNIEMYASFRNSCDVDGIDADVVIDIVVIET